MNRIHALEWEDLRYFPRSWRDYGTDYLHFIAMKFELYKPVLPLINEALEKSGQQEWVDCASGGGGGFYLPVAYCSALHLMGRSSFYPAHLFRKRDATIGTIAQKLRSL